MRVAIVSDIHGNRHAFEAVLGAAREAAAEELWCLGDVVGYGADPDACCALVREHAVVCLAGNHDLAVTGALDLDEFSRGAALAARWTQDVIDAEHLAWLGDLDPTGERAGVGLFHGSPRDPVWEYVLSPMAADRCFDAMPQRVGLIGHSHVALSFRRTDEEEARGEPRGDGDRAGLRDDRWLLNPGSVGQPRDGDPRAAWGLLDLDGARFAWQRTPYDVAGAQDAIRAAGLPPSLADRLEHGQ